MCKSRSLTPYKIGLICLLVYNFLTAVKGVLLGRLLQNVDTFLVPWVSFVTVTLCFVFINVIKDRAYIGKSIFIFKLHWPTLLHLNVASLCAWVSFYYALRYLEPAVVVAVTSGSGPLLTTIYLQYMARVRSVGIFTWVCCGLIAASAGYLLLETVRGNSGVGVISKGAAMGGCLLSMLAGVATVSSTVLSKRANSFGMSAIEILPFRFVLLVLAAFLVWVSDSKSMPSVHQWLIIAFLACFGLAIPILLVQVGIHLTDPKSVALVYSLLPVFVLILQFFDPRLTISKSTLIGSSMLVIGCVLAFLEGSKSRST